MKPTGAIASTPDARDSDFHASDLYAGATPPARRDYDFRNLHTWRIQGAPSCVAYSLVAKVQSLAKAQGRPVETLSAELNWWGARDLALPPGTQLTGSSCRLNIKYARDVGLKSEAVFPDEAANHMRVPPIRVLEAAPLVKVAKYHRILGETNPNKLRDGILTAFSLLEKGLCSMPGAVMPVGSGYAQTEDGEAWDGTIGEDWGTHDQAIGLYRASDDCVGFLSSWEERVYWMPVPLLAERGFEFWVLDGLEYVGSELAHAA